MGNDLSIWTLVLDASPIVQAVMVLLLGASVASWAVIFKKSRVISYSIRQADQFETAFWSGGDLSTLYRSIETKGREGTGEQSIFESGFGEFSRLRQQGLPTDQLLEGARRAMRVAQMREQDRLERNLAMIATAIGLFAAIPAVVAYNRFADQVSRLELRFDTFVEEFSTILQRHGPARAPSA